LSGASMMSNAWRGRHSYAMVVLSSQQTVFEDPPR
jgi:hypothetical protein